MSDAPPTTLRDGRYTLVRTLGQGSQGQTWEATDHVGGGTVAIKQFNVRGARAWKEVELAEREARVLKKLAHPLLPAYVEHFEEDDALYLVMEKVEGTPLSIVQKQGGLAEPAVRRFLADADLALSYLHCWSPPIIHRDIKPSNVIQRPDGSYAFVDFGAVREHLQPEGGSTVVGTFGFMAPEQFQGRACPASDVYAVAATAVAMLTCQDPDRLPHRGLVVDLAKALEGRASPGLTAALSQMLQLDPDARPAAVGPVLASISSGVQGAPRARGKTGVRSALVLAGCLAALGSAIIGVRSARPPPPVVTAIPPAPERPPAVPPQTPPPPPPPRAPEPMVPLPGGTFVTRDLGRTATVEPFEIDANQVTAAEMRACVEAGRCSWKGRDGNYLWPGTSQFPMNYVTWEEAAGYCAAQGKDLPSEEEWEWAMRGGDEGRKYPWGDTPVADRVCRDGCGGCPVGTHLRSDARGGIHDLSEEAWTRTPDRGSAHVVRGWRWRFEPVDRDVERAAVGATERFCGLGFRCIRSAHPAPKVVPVPPATLTWSGRVRSSTGAAPGAAPGAGSPCVLATTVASTETGDDTPPTKLTCGGVVLYDASLPVEGISSYSFRLEEHEAGTGAFRYSLENDDTGARRSGRTQVSVNTPQGVAEAFRETAPSFRVTVALDKLSAPRKGAPLSPR